MLNHDPVVSVLFSLTEVSMVLSPCLEFLPAHRATPPSLREGPPGPAGRRCFVALFVRHVFRVASPLGVSRLRRLALLEVREEVSRALLCFFQKRARSLE